MLDGGWWGGGVVRQCGSAAVRQWGDTAVPAVLTAKRTHCQGPCIVHVIANICVDHAWRPLPASAYSPLRRLRRRCLRCAIPNTFSTTNTASTLTTLTTGTSLATRTEWHEQPELGRRLPLSLRRGCGASFNSPLVHVVARSEYCHPLAAQALNLPVVAAVVMWRN